MSADPVRLGLAAVAVLLWLLLTVVILVIVMSGSIWVMHHMNQNMMPGMGPNSTHTMT